MRVEGPGATQTHPCGCMLSCQGWYDGSPPETLVLLNACLFFEQVAFQKQWFCLMLYSFLNRRPSRSICFAQCILISDHILSKFGVASKAGPSSCCVNSVDTPTEAEFGGYANRVYARLPKIDQTWQKPDPIAIPASGYLVLGCRLKQPPSISLSLLARLVRTTANIYCDKFHKQTTRINDNDPDIITSPTSFV